MRYECNGCDRTWRNEQELQRTCTYLWPNLPSLQQRLEPGDVVPAAECPSCHEVVLPVFEALARQPRPPDDQPISLPGNIVGVLRHHRNPTRAEFTIEVAVNGRVLTVDLPDHLLREAPQRMADVVAHYIAREILAPPPPLWQTPFMRGGSRW